MNHTKQTKIWIMAAAVGFILLGSVSHVKAYQNYQHYSNGWDAGQTDAQYDWSNNYNKYYSYTACHHHTQDYCDGYSQGYDEYWGRAQQVNSDSNNNVAENNANVKVDGNNNHVEINQNNGQSTGNGNDNNGGGY